MIDKAQLLTDDPIFKVGRNPMEMGPEGLKKAGIGFLTPMEAIRARCIDCSNTASEVAKCTAVNCALWPYRMGTSPYRKRELTDEQRSAMAERLNKVRHMRANPNP